MKRSSGSFLVAALALALGALPVFGQKEKQLDEQRSAAASLLALGRVSSAATPPATDVKATVAERIALHRKQLAADSALHRATVDKAFADTLGRAPTEQERQASASPVRTYSELVAAELKRLADDPAAYSRLIHRAYRRIAGRDAYDAEIAYWNRHDRLPFALLLAAVQNWARRNQPGLTVTSGTAIVSPNSDYLCAVPLSPAVADEARVALGFVSADSIPTPTAYGKNVVGSGAGQLVTDGHIAFAYAGSEIVSSLANR
ncbi:hypothetical protein DB347_07525 [Opitutaceae bacterium EW11]|nr:hypothetical protein DB347_07525 [Opitutaceae bacterium EW11]